MVELGEFAARARMVAQQAVVDRAAITTLQAFEEAGIDTLVLKGPVLARTLYRSDEHRGYFDLDLLVHPKDRLAAGEVLAGLGYVDFVKTSGLRVFPDDPHADLWVQRTERSLSPVDLHWRLPGCEADPVRLWGALWARRTWVDLDGLRAPALDRTGLSLHVALHAAQHGTEDRKAMGDLGRGLSRWSVEVWRDAAQLAAEVGAREAFSAGLRLLPAGAALANQLGLPAAEELLATIGERKSRPRGTFHLQALIEADGLRRRLSVLRWSLFPQHVWITRAYPWARRSWLHRAAAYLLHLAHAPGWTIRAWRFQRLTGRNREIPRTNQRSESIGP